MGTILRFHRAALFMLLIPASVANIQLSMLLTDSAEGTPVEDLQVPSLTFDAEDELATASNQILASEQMIDRIPPRQVPTGAGLSIGTPTQIQQLLEVTAATGSEVRSAACRACLRTTADFKMCARDGMGCDVVLVGGKGAFV